MTKVMQSKSLRINYLRTYWEQSVYFTFLSEFTKKIPKSPANYSWGSKPDTLRFPCNRRGAERLMGEHVLMGYTRNSKFSSEHFAQPSRMRGVFCYDCT